MSKSNEYTKEADSYARALKSWASALGKGQASKVGDVFGIGVREVRTYIITGGGPGVVLHVIFDRNDDELEVVEAWLTYRNGPFNEALRRNVDKQTAQQLVEHWGTTPT